MEGWDEFSHEMSKYYNVDISVLTAAFEREQQEYYQQTVVWADIHPSQLRGAGVPFKSFDLLKVTVEELKEALKVGGLNMYCENPDVGTWHLMVGDRIYCM